MGERLKLGVLVSGRGTNLQAIMDAIERGEVPAEIAVVVSNRADAYALERARRRGVPTVVIERGRFGSRVAHQLALAEELRRRGVELVVLAGFDRVLVPEFLAAFPLRVLNVHPSLLPAFGGGLHAQADALAYGVKVAGCTVHFVTNDVDAGPIVAQAAVPVLEDDTVETLSARILAEEHRILPQAISLYAQRRLVVDGRRVRILPASEHGPMPS